MCIKPPKPTQGHETMTATLNFSINHSQRIKEAFAFFKDFLKWCKCMTKFIFKSHLGLSRSSNGQWNDKFPTAAIIHLLRSVKYIFKLLKITTSQDKTGRKIRRHFFPSHRRCWNLSKWLFLLDFITFNRVNSGKVFLLFWPRGSSLWLQTGALYG